MLDITHKKVDLSRVVRPPALMLPAPFWCWNEMLTPEEARRQIHLLAEGGLGGAFVHVRVGLLTQYMGEEFFAAFSAALEEARTLGLHLYLYDEDRWPSGWGAGAVPLRDESYRVKWLLRVPAGTDLPTDQTQLLTLLAKDDNNTQYYRYVSPLGLAWFSGTTYADLMDEAAMRTFLEVAYEPYAVRYGADFGTLIPAIFTDEPAITFLPAYAGVPLGMLFWTDALPQTFRDQHGYDILPHLDSLFEDIGDFAAIRTDYYRTCAWLFEQHYSQQLGAWARQHHIALTGHFMREDTLTGNLAWDVNAQPSYRHFDWPGIDHLGRQITEVITGLGCRSTVNQYAKPRMMTELYGTAGQHLSFADRKWIAEQQIVLGVNMLVPHLSLYTMAGERKRDYPCNIFYQQSWWSYNAVLETYLGRICAIMSQGQMRPEFLVLHPQESLYPIRRPPTADQPAWAEYHSDDAARILLVDESFRDLSQLLLGLQRSFDYGDETILEDIGQVEMAGTTPLIRVGAMVYPFVILPAMTTIRATTLALLEKFAQAGGPIVSFGSLPGMIDGRPDAMGRLARFLAEHVQSLPFDTVETSFSQILPPLVTFEGIGPRRWLWHHLRHVGDQHILLLVNLSRFEVINGTVTIAIPGPVSQLDLTHLQAHAVRSAGDITIKVPLFLEAGESTVLLIGDDDLESFTQTSSPRGTSAHAWPLTEWEGERLEPNALPIDMAKFRKGNEPLSPLMPILAIQEFLNKQNYSGPLTLALTFEADYVPASAQLVMEHPERCHISVNDQRVAYNGLPYWHDIRWLPMDITNVIHLGTNHIELIYDEFTFGDVLSISDQAKRYGTEIEAVYLIGDFHVSATPASDLDQVAPPEGTPPWDLETLEGPFRLIAPNSLHSGDLVWQGLPFYADQITLRTQINLDSPLAKEIWIEFEELSVPIVEIMVNGQSAGVIGWRPYRLNIEAWLHEGENMLEVRLAMSLRNLLGPHHHPQGEPYWVGPDSFRGQSENWVVQMSQGMPTSGWRNSYAVTRYGLLGAMTLHAIQ